MKQISIITLIFSVFTLSLFAQTKKEWKYKKCAVVLTYDDALDVHLDNVIPTLNKYNFKGTFYVQGDSKVLKNRMSEWRNATLKGHELGNHSMTHACDGSLEGRGWVGSEQDLNNYTVHRAVNEIRVTNTLLEAIDGKKRRTFAYPCGDLMINGIPYYKDLVNDFVAARGSENGLEQKNTIDRNDMKCIVINGHTAEEMIQYVKEAERENAMIVFLFHGVGGGHVIDVSKKEHLKLIKYLSDHKKDIWVTSMVEAAEFIFNN